MPEPPWSQSTPAASTPCTSGTWTSSAAPTTSSRGSSSPSSRTPTRRRCCPSRPGSISSSAAWPGCGGIEVTSFSGLLVDFMQQSGARVILRGMRAVSDFEYEFQIALMNRRLWAQAETVFLTPNEEFTYLSSRVVKEIWQLGGDVSGLVPGPVFEVLRTLPLPR